MFDKKDWKMFPLTMPTAASVEMKAPRARMMKEGPSMLKAEVRLKSGLQAETLTGEMKTTALLIKTAGYFGPLEVQHKCDV